MPGATCKSCRKTFKVPDRAKTYRCPACGGKVSAGRDEPQVEGTACPSCKTINVSPGARFCEECGKPLDEAAAPARSAAGGRGRSLARPDERRAASHVRRALQRLTLTRVCLVLATVVYGGFFTILLLTYLFGKTTGPGVPVVATIMGVIFAINLVGCRQLSTQPLLWSILVASMVTVDVFYEIAIGGFPIIKALILTALWGGVVGAANVRKILRQHPDMRINAKLVARGGKIYRKKMELQSAAGTRAQERARKSRRRRNQQLIVIGGVAVAAIFVIATILQLSKPMSFEEKVLLFNETWNAESGMDETITKVVEFCVDERREEMRRKLETYFERYGWQENRPKLNLLDKEFSEGYSAHWANYSIDGVDADVPFKVLWRQDDAGRWYLSTFRFSKSLRSR